MTERKFDKETIWVTCSSCGHKHRKHRVLYEKRVHIVDEPDGPEIGRDYHRLAECMGCETIKYVTSRLDLRGYGEYEEPQESNIVVYPDATGNDTRRTPAISFEDATDDMCQLLIPELVWKMYRETIDALNADIRTLAGGGLRAVVEAICVDKNIANGDLQTKIEGLVKQGLLAKPQAELLHEERYIGNAALHELTTPSAQDIEDGLGIVEGLINAIYILPSKAARLKQRREAKSKPAPPRGENARPG